MGIGGLAPAAAGGDAADVDLVAKGVDQVRGAGQQQLRGDQAGAWHRLERVQERIEPAGARLGVRVQEDQHASTSHRGTDVACGAKAAIRL
jgi:hypothetical protein